MGERQGGAGCSSRGCEIGLQFGYGMGHTSAPFFIDASHEGKNGDMYV
jgi:hypothetical protein